MVAYKGAEFWMRVTLAILAGALFLTVHAVYWPVVISLILTFILMPIRDGVIKGLRRLTGRHVPIDLAILISFVILIVIVTIITNIIVKPLVIQVNLLAANFNDLVSQTAALTRSRKSSTMPLSRSAITASRASPTSSSPSLPLPGRSSNSSSYRSLLSTS